MRHTPVGALALVFLGAACSASDANGPKEASVSTTDAGAAIDAAVAASASADGGAEALPPADAGAPSDATTAPPGDDAGAADAGSPPLLTALSISTGALRPSFDPNVLDYEVTSLNALFPLRVTATSCACASTLSIHGTPATSGAPLSFTLSPGEDIAIVVAAPNGAGATYTIHYTPSDLPPYAVSPSDAGLAGTEPLLLSVQDYALVLDRTGVPLYYRTFAPQEAQNLQRHVLPSGATVYSVSVGEAGTAWSLGVDHLMDDHFEDLGDVQLLPNRGHGALPSEGHDFLLLDDQHYVTMTYFQRSVNLSGMNPVWSAQATVISPIVQEVDHGVVQLEWDSANVPSLYEDSVDQNSFSDGVVSDYLHLNALAIDPVDQNLVLSLRHANAVLKVDRTTGNILWTLGGAEDDFGLTGDEVFSHQHHVHFESDGSLVIFDNGNNGPGLPVHQTRILRFVLDETNHQVSSFQIVYTRPEGEPATTFMGSATQLDPARYLIGWGGWSTASTAPGITEIVSGVPVWSLTFSMPNVFSYRALPIPHP
ncbi:MAG TPA: aryl-sulfate sulfotransferase [Polyangiaceae bacterium]|jgi:hypothetical protein